MKIRYKGDQPGKFRIINLDDTNKRSNRITVTKTNYISIPDGIKINKKIYDVLEDSQGPFRKGKDTVQPLVKNKKDHSKDPAVLKRIEEIKADLADDGKLNYSNNEGKKSPGRPKKKR